jgi:tRNA pseudouridine13 synthase
MKLRFVPEDFRVSEQFAPHLCAGRGPYGVYLLTKRGWNTADALARAARELGVPLRFFRYGGRKDRWAVTEQVVTFLGDRDCSGDWGGFSLRYLGRASEPMAPSLIKGNHFEITVRDLAPPEAQIATARAEVVRASGFPNYFDDQRFGSVRDGCISAGDLLVRRQWEEALRALVALPGPDDPPAVRRHRAELAGLWGDWGASLKAAAGGVERRVFALLAADPGAARAAVNLLPRETLSLHLAAWQSQVWNDMLRHLVREGAGPDGMLHIHSWPGAAGPYLFPASPQVTATLVNRELPTMGRKVAWQDTATETLTRDLLAAQGLRPEDFVLRGLPKVQLYSAQRAAAVVPRDLMVSCGEDEHHPGRHKLNLRFALPAGSFGTMLVKACHAADGSRIS